MSYSSEGLVDLGITEYVQVHGRGASERISETEFATPYWVWQRDGTLWVRAVRFYMTRPILSAACNGEFYHSLQMQKAAVGPPVLHS